MRRRDFHERAPQDSCGIVVAIGMILLLAGACEDPPKATPSVPDAADPPPPPPPREGCARFGILDGIENDPSCAAKVAPSEDAVRLAMKQLEVSVTSEVTEIYSGGIALLTLKIKNVSSAEASVWLESRARTSGARTDWSRVVGVPEPHPGTNDLARLFFPITTTDQWDRDVDGVPTVGSGSAPAPNPLLVRLPAGKRLYRKIEWFALRIPAPAPMFQDDAGHRFYPKTLAIPLTPGEYGVAIDLPFFALSKEERKQTLRLKVLANPRWDGGIPK